MWGRLSLAGLLLAGCAFHPGGSSSGSDPDAGAPPALPDSAPGAPDATTPVPPDAAPVEPVLLETLTISVTDSEPVQSGVVLVAGRTYRLVASGTAIVRDDDAGRYDGDADYWWNDIVRGDTTGGVDLGLAVNDYDGNASRSPDWGDYTGSHVYEATIPGDDKLLSAVYFDPDYDNGNSGSLTLEVWGPP